MNTELQPLMEYFRLINKIRGAIEKSGSIEDALQKSLNCFADEIRCDFIIFWLAEKDSDLLHPHYWLGPRDFSHCVRRAGEGVVGRVFASGEAVTCFDYQAGDDPEIERDMKEIPISSMICVPFESGSVRGCIQLFHDNGDHFDGELSEIAQILVLLISTTLEDSDLVREDWRFNEVLLSLEQIEKSYQSGEEVTKVLKGIDLKVFKGEFLVLLGESGCGKSTLLNIIGGMNQADAGSYRYEGRELQNASPAELTAFRRKNVGFIFQGYHLMPNLTAIQNIDFIGELVEDPLDSRKLLEEVNLADKKDLYPSQLSGGQQQRVSIARALVKHPQLILADEPTAALDSTTSIEVLSLLSHIIRHGSTLVMVTHNEEITRMADRIVRIRDGRVHEIRINRKPAPAEDLVW
ncbi:MAG: ATP-binding cassette domain-containing protein [Lachnospiraceae bacterium]|nr:ATP-binding cassette domain-containing protein [Lachnospiraceae bacterium]